jgi:hypothetical protein
MVNPRKNRLYFPILILALIVSACSTPLQNDSEIATAVAQTVQAQDSLTKLASTPTSTPVPPTEAISTPETPPTETSAPLSAAPGCTVSARLASENPPDNVLLKPGEDFLKTWTLQNTGTCTWDTSYKLVYMSGDLMEALVSYSLPEAVAPNNNTNISIFLRAPATEGTFTGYWKILTPWGVYFGVGPGSDPFYVQIATTSDRRPKYGITSVTYNVVREPETGCPTNVRYTVYATITTNGPYEFEYYWDQSDGNESAKKTLVFTQAESRTLSREWMIGKGDSPNPRWIMIIVTVPIYQEYSKAVILNNCP